MHKKQQYTTFSLIKHLYSAPPPPLEKAKNIIFFEEYFLNDTFYDSTSLCRYIKMLWCNTIKYS